MGDLWQSLTTNWGLTRCLNNQDPPPLPWAILSAWHYRYMIALQSPFRMFSFRVIYFMAFLASHLWIPPQSIILPQSSSSTNLLGCSSPHPGLSSAESSCQQQLFSSSLSQSHSQPTGIQNHWSFKSQPSSLILLHILLSPVSPYCVLPLLPCYQHLIWLHVWLF